MTWRCDLSFCVPRNDIRRAHRSGVAVPVPASGAATPEFDDLEEGCHA